MEWRDIIEEGGVARIVGTRIKTNSDYVVPICMVFFLLLADAS